MKHTFKNGTVLEGTMEHLLKVAELFKEELGPTYTSKDTGAVTMISEMNTTHIRNALVKLARDYYIIDNFKTLKLNDFLEKFTGVANSDEVVNLYNELVKRVETED